MPKQSKIKLTKFTYPNGSAAWRVSGSIDGKQIRKNFSDRAEALEEKQRLEIRQTNGDTHGRHMWVKISHKQHDDAWTALKLLDDAGSKKSLTFGIQFYLKYYRESEAKTLRDSVQEYLNEKSRDEERKIISPRQYRSIRIELDRLKAKLGNPFVGEIDTETLRTYLSDKPAGLKTWNNRRGYLSTFFKFCVAKKYAGHDPVVDVPQYKLKHRRSTAETLSAKKAADLMTYLETYQGETRRPGHPWGKPGCMVPYFALILFAGVRPDWENGEIKKLQPEHIDLETRVIRIEPDVSKVNEKRSICIQPNLQLWLEKYPLDKFPIMPPVRFAEMRKAIRDEFNLGHDVLRHTFISMLVGAFRSVGDASLQAGNSEAIIRRHYLDLKSPNEADNFWRITPAGTELPAKFEKKDGRYVFQEEEEEEGDGSEKISENPPESNIQQP